jgi:nicotinamide mononucleotide transporter
VWIAVDLISIPVYLSRSLLLVALLYVIFLGLAINGWFAWRRVAGAT